MTNNFVLEVKYRASVYGALPAIVSMDRQHMSERVHNINLISVSKNNDMQSIVTEVNNLKTINKYMYIPQHNG